MATAVGASALDQARVEQRAERLFGTYTESVVTDPLDPVCVARKGARP